MIWTGIDPGLTGAIAALDDDGHVIVVRDMPVDAEGVDGPELASLLWDLPSPDEGILVAVEQQVGFASARGRRQSNTSSFTVGRNYGVILGVLTGMGFRSVIVRARTWQAALLKGVPGANAKQRSLALAELKWPGEELHGPRGGVRDGRADALNIAAYGRLAHAHR